jgi:hypothetical protein
VVVINDLGRIPQAETDPREPSPSVLVVPVSVPCADVAPSWRSGVGAAVDAIDYLMRDWRKSRKKAVLLCADELDAYLQVVHDLRHMHDPTTYAEAFAASKAIIASAIEARSGETERLDGAATKARAEGDAQGPLA